MIKLENTEVIGWEHAIRGMRNPMNSWDKSDSGYCGGDHHLGCANCARCETREKAKDLIKVDYDLGLMIKPCGRREFEYDYQVGFDDLELMKNLSKAGTDHRKFMRMIVVYVDIVAPMYWWKEFDTYKVGTVRNSCSTMHKITAKEFDYGDFSLEHLVSTWPGSTDNGINVVLPGPIENIQNNIIMLNRVRDSYLLALKNESKVDLSSKDIWWQLIQLLPSSYNQRATVMMNYEVLANMYHARKNHKLDEWHRFCDWVETLPYSEIITGQEI